jgi:gamma-glutamyltranspeptidase/glutathione hydrolase/leukotriene-C4 hydrolase
MAVAVTCSVNFAYGSQVLDPETGVVLNNQMDDFSSYKPNGPNDSDQIR